MIFSDNLMVSLQVNRRVTEGKITGSASTQSTAVMFFIFVFFLYLLWSLNSRKAQPVDKEIDEESHFTTGLKAGDVSSRRLIKSLQESF